MATDKSGGNPKGPIVIVIKPDPEDARKDAPPSPPKK